MRVVWGELGKRAGAGVSVGERMRTEAIWWARAGAYKRADVGGAYAGGSRSVCERWQVLRRVVQGGRCKRAVSGSGMECRCRGVCERGRGESIIKA